MMTGGAPRRARGGVRMAAMTALLALSLVAVAACASGTTTPSAAAVLANARLAFNQLTAFHFTLVASHLGDSDPLPITQASGDVKRPDQLSTTATVNSAFGEVQVKLIILGSQEWITNPITGSYQTTTGYGGFLTIFDPQHGVGAALEGLQNPSTPQDSSSSAGACWKISGTLEPGAVAGVVSGTATSSTANIPTTVCIGKSDNELYSITLSGAISQTDTAQTTRTFVLTKFNQAVTISAPSVTPGA